MARKVVFVDDLDGTEIPDGEGGTVTFSLRGDFYELDLGEKSQAKLDKALESFISKATKVAAPHSAVPGRPAKRTTKVSGAGRDYLDAVRRWARDNGHEVSNRGRVAAHIVEAYEQATSK